MVNKHRSAPLVTVVIVLALIVGVSIWVTRSNSVVDPKQDSADSAQEPEVGAPMRAVPSGTGSLAPTAPPSPADLLATLAANEAAVSRVTTAGREKLRSRYESERVDTAWASNKQQALERLSVSPQIEQLNAQPLSIQARCRTSVCLIDVDFATRLAADDWHTLYTLNAGTEMSASSSTSSANPDGSVHLQIYGLAREGKP